MGIEIWVNQDVGRVTAIDHRNVREFHARLPGYEPSPLSEAPALANELGISRLWIKKETQRFGLPSFKILGASWAIYQLLLQRLGGSPRWGTWEELRDAVEGLGPLTLLAATDGNHGRAVAHVASSLGLSSRIFVPQGMAEARMRAIKSEGADVIVVDGDYDEAVRRAAASSGPRALVVSDTSWPGYEQVPAWVSEGYATLFLEADDQLKSDGAPAPTTVIVPVGVGALAAACVRHFRAADAASDSCVVTVEPTTAACLLRSLQAGGPTAAPGPHTSIMAGLNCGFVSLVAWPVLFKGVSVAVAIEDEPVRAAMRSLASVGTMGGETGAAALAGLAELLRATDPAVAGPSGARVREAAHLGPESSVLIFVTEGPTDPDGYRAIVKEGPGD
jgi:diaminopropionate ammonia-lyase